MAKEINIKEELTLNKEDLYQADFEVAKAALEHLVNLTKTYIDNVHKMGKTYTNEFVRLGLAMEVGISICGGKNMVVTSGFGRVEDLVKTCLANVKTFLGRTDDNDDETERS